MSAVAVKVYVKLIVTGGAQPDVPVRIPRRVVPVGAARTGEGRVVAVAAE